MGEDNYITFKSHEEKNKINTRANNINQRLGNYNTCFIERENAISLCRLVMSLHLKTQLEQDCKKLEDLEFDRLMGKAPPKTNSSMSELDIISESC